MKTSRFSLIVTVLVLITTYLSNPTKTLAAEAAMQVWTDSTGRQISASVEGFKDKNTVIFRLKNGRSLPYPIKNLNLEGQNLALQFYAEHGENKTPDIDWKKPQLSPNYIIRGVRREHAPGYISTKSGWEWRGKCIEARVVFKGNSSSAPGNISAYFYNREGKLLDKFDKPPHRQDENRKYVSAPKDFQKNKTLEVYFPLTKFLEDSKWATALIVFGSGEDYSAKTMPGTSFEALDFAEKEYLFPNWKPAADENKNASPSNNYVELEIRRFKQENHPRSMYFDGDYQRGKDCMMAEVRVKGEITPGNGSVKLHVFDAAGKLVASRKGPSSTNLNGTGSYVSNPQIADERWHPVFFALDGDLDGKDYPTYVITFRFDGKTSALAKSSVGATLANLDYPGK